MWGCRSPTSPPKKFLTLREYIAEKWSFAITLFGCPETEPLFELSGKIKSSSIKNLPGI